jgi:hypothetical protein
VAQASLPVNLGRKLSGWDALFAVVVAVVLGYLAGLLSSRAYYKAQIRTSQLERDSLLGQLQAIEPSYEALKRLGVYTDHIQNTLAAVLDGKLSVNGLPAEPDARLERAFCEMPHELILTAAQKDVRFSIWIEGRLKIRRDRFSIVCAPHNESEKTRFNVRIRNSWLQHGEEHLKQHPESRRLHAIDDLNIAGLFGDDIAVFREAGYESVRAFAFEVDGRPIRLVALSAEPLAFSEVEDRYLLLLRLTLVVAARLATGGNTPAAAA